MADSSNFLIDSFDILSGCNDDSEIWAGMHKILDSVGANHLVTSEMTKSDKECLWLRTSMSSDWIDEYIDQGYFNVDPIAQRGLMNSISTSINCGEMEHITPDMNMLARQCNLGLRDAGYSHVRSRSFSPIDSASSQFVSVCFANGANSSFVIDDVKVDQVQSLISIFMPTPKSSSVPGLIKQGAHALSVRERDVLSYMSKGMRISQISYELGLSEGTVAKHFNSAKRRLNATTREHAMAIAMTSGALSI